MELNENIQRACESIAKKLSQNDDEFSDALQEGLTKVLEMKSGHTNSYYIEYAKRRMQDYLRRERKIINHYIAFEEGNCESKIIKSRYGYKSPVAELNDGCGNDEK